MNRSDMFDTTLPEVMAWGEKVTRPAKGERPKWPKQVAPGIWECDGKLETDLPVGLADLEDRAMLDADLGEPHIIGVDPGAAGGDKTVYLSSQWVTVDQRHLFDDTKMIPFKPTPQMQDAIASIERAMQRTWTDCVLGGISRATTPVNASYGNRLAAVQRKTLDASIEGSQRALAKLQDQYEQNVERDYPQLTRGFGTHGTSIVSHPAYKAEQAEKNAAYADLLDRMASIKPTTI